MFPGDLIFYRDSMIISISKRIPVSVYYIYFLNSFIFTEFRIHFKYVDAGVCVSDEVFSGYYKYSTIKKTSFKTAHGITTPDNQIQLL